MKFQFFEIGLKLDKKLKENQNNSDNKNSNKSTSVEKQDISEEIIEPIESNKKVSFNAIVFFPP